MKRMLIASAVILIFSSIALGASRMSNAPSPLVPDGHGGYDLPTDLTTDGLTVGETTQKTYIDPTTGLSTYAVNVGTPLSSASVEKTVLYFNVVNGSGVTLPGVYMAVEITNATNARTGMTLYGTNIDGVAIPVFSTFGMLWANPQTGASVYYSGDTIWWRQANGVLRAVTGVTP